VIELCFGLKFPLSLDHAVQQEILIGKDYRSEVCGDCERIVKSNLFSKSLDIGCLYFIRIQRYESQK